MKKTIVIAATSATMFLCSAHSHAAQLMYGFNSPTIDGFSLSYDSTGGDGSVLQSTTTGVTEGTGALNIHLATGAGNAYTQLDAQTNNLPANLVLPGTNSLSLDATATYQNANYITVAPIFYLDGTTNGTTAFSYKFTIPSKTLTTDGSVNADTFSLLVKDPYATANGSTPADGDTTTGTYTPGHIAAALTAAIQANNALGGAAIDHFAFEETTNPVSVNPGTGNNNPDLGDDLFVDNVTIPGSGSVPEPTSLGLLAAGGLMLKRWTRRR